MTGATSDGERLAAIRALLAAIAPGEWSRAADGEGEFVETQGPRGELWMLCRFDPGASPQERKFVEEAPEMVRFLLALVDRAIAAAWRRANGGEPAPAADKNHAAEASMLCGSVVFQRFLAERHGLELDGDHAAREARTAQRVRSMLGIASRREINGPARDAWKALRREFYQWKGRAVT